MVRITSCGKPSLDREKLEIAPACELALKVVDLNYREITQVSSISLTNLVEDSLVQTKIRFP